MLIHGIGSLLRRRPDWNRRGPDIPLWFRRRLCRLDPGLVLQYVPPRSLRDPQGVPPSIYPHGVVNICRQLPRTKFLHPTIVWSLADVNGNYRVPDLQGFRDLETAYLMNRARRNPELIRKVDDCLALGDKAQEDRSINDMMHWLQKTSELCMSRQWTNRVYLKAGVA